MTACPSSAHCSPCSSVAAPQGRTLPADRLRPPWSDQACRISVTRSAVDPSRPPPPRQRSSLSRSTSSTSLPVDRPAVVPQRGTPTPTATPMNHRTPLQGRTTPNCARGWRPALRSSSVAWTRVARERSQSLWTSSPPQSRQSQPNPLGRQQK